MQHSSWGLDASRGWTETPGLTVSFRLLAAQSACEGTNSQYHHATSMTEPVCCCFRRWLCSDQLHSRGGALVQYCQWHQLLQLRTRQQARDGNILYTQARTAQH